MKEQEAAGLSGSKADAQPSYGRELCLLSLDGGGVRGLSSLQILKQLMEYINPENPPKPCDYFDMIGGTSTGGLIAIMLGRLCMSVDECMEEYKCLSSSVFTKLHHRLTLRGKIQGRFDHNALVDGIQELLGQRNVHKEALLREPSTSSTCKTFVCSTSKETSQTVIFTSYFSKRWTTVAKIWEVARATSAASSFFDPIYIDGEGFIDGATGANNPIHEMWTEAFDAFNEGAGWRLEDNFKCLVSIGTGIPSIKSFGNDPMNIAEALLSIALDTEKNGEIFQRHHSALFKEDRAFRFNVVRGLEDVGLEEASKQGRIISVTKHYLASEEVVGKLDACSKNLKKREWLSQFFKYASHRYKLVMKQQVPHNVDDEVVRDLYLSFSHTQAFQKWLGPSSGPLWCCTSNISGNLCQSFGAQIAKLVTKAICSKQESRKQMWHVLYLPLKARSSTPFDTEMSEQAPQYTNTALKALIVQAVFLHGQNILHMKKRIWLLPLAQRKTLQKILGSEVSDHELTVLLAALLCLESKQVILLLDQGQNLEEYEMFNLLATLYSSVIDRNLRLLVTARPDLHMKSALSGIARIASDTEYFECLASLHFEGHHTRRDQIIRAQDGTNQWIWFHSVYLAFKNELSSILWIEGKPGSGKSVLAKSIQQSLLLSPQGNPSTLESHHLLSPAMASWFYTARSSRELTTHKSFLRSICYQLLKQDQTLFSFFVDFYRRAFSEDQRWTKDILEEILSSINRSSLPLVCVVDAVDEAENATILPFLTKLALTEPLSMFKFIILSRPEQSIRHNLDRCYRITLQNVNQADIQRIVQVRLDEICQKMHSTRSTAHQKQNFTRGVPPARQGKRIKPYVGFEAKEIEEINGIHSYLLEHAQGVILWVSMILDILKAFMEDGIFTFREVKAKLISLPLDLEDLYRGIASNLSKDLGVEKVAKSRKALMWISAASETRSVTISELWEALAVPSEPADESYSGDLLAENTIPIDSWDDCCQKLYELCGPFAEVIKPSPSKGYPLYFEQESGPFDILQLMHQTVREFLANEDSSGFLHFRPYEADTLVKALTENYLVIAASQQDQMYAQITFDNKKPWESYVEDALGFLNRMHLLKFAMEYNKGSATFKALRESYWLLLNHWVSTAPASSPLTDDMPLRLTTRPGQEKPTLDYLTVERLFWIACTKGYTTATANLIYISTFEEAWCKRYNFATLNGALLAAHDHGIKLPNLKYVVDESNTFLPAVINRVMEFSLETPHEVKDPLDIENSDVLIAIHLVLNNRKRVDINNLDLSARWLRHLRESLKKI